MLRANNFEIREVYKKNDVNIISNLLNYVLNKYCTKKKFLRIENLRFFSIFSRKILVIQQNNPRSDQLLRIPYPILDISFD